MILSGDDWVRTTNELKWTATTPWAADVAKHIWTKLRDSEVVTAVEMMDEASFLGDGPAPTDGHWAKADPAIHDKTLVNLIEAIRSVENHTPISWPVLGLAGPESAASWMGDRRYADYASQYWTTMDWRGAYPWGTSGLQMKSDLERVMVHRFPLMQWDKPQLMLVSGCGPFYSKKVEGDHFHAGLDEGLPSAPSPAQIADQPLYAALSGAAGVGHVFGRLQLEGRTGPGQAGSTRPADRGQPLRRRQRPLARPLGGLQPARPAGTVPAAATNQCDRLGVGLHDSARRGAGSRLLMAINWSQAPRSVNVDLTPYLLFGVEKIERYRVLGGASSVDLLPAAPRDSLTFQPGEFVAWLVRAPGKTGDTVPPAVRLALPYEANHQRPTDASRGGSGQPRTEAGRVLRQRQIDRCDHESAVCDYLGRCQRAQGRMARPESRRHRCRRQPERSPRDGLRGSFRAVSGDRSANRRSVRQRFD